MPHVILGSGVRGAQQGHHDGPWPGRTEGKETALEFQNKISDMQGAVKRTCRPTSDSMAASTAATITCSQQVDRRRPCDEHNTPHITQLTSHTTPHTTHHTPHTTHHTFGCMKRSSEPITSTMAWSLQRKQGSRDLYRTTCCRRCVLMYCTCCFQASETRGEVVLCLQRALHSVKL